MAEPLLSVDNLSVTFSNWDNPVVEQVSFSVQQGQALGLVGESGSGKSLTVLSIMQLLPEMAKVSYASEIYFKQENLLTLSERKMRHIRGKKIAMIFQDAMSALNPVLTIGHQITEILTHHLSMSHSQAYLQAEHLLTEVGIDNVHFCLRAYAHQLSGGMRQRAMIAMALAGNPDLLIADEPTTALDVTIQCQILTLLKHLSQRYRMSLLFISHDLSIVGQLVDDIVVLQKGRKVEQASRREFFLQPQHPYSQKLLQAILPRFARRKMLDNTSTLLTVADLTVNFKHIKAVDNISFEIRAGETFALVGESGCGKTTIAKAIMQLVPVTCGAVILDGVSLNHLSSRLMRKHRGVLQMIFQDPFSALDPRMMIADSLMEGLMAQHKVSSRHAALERVDFLLTQVDLPLYAKWRYPHEFSGGEQQRLCIARALSLEPKLLILDEPTSALDVSIQKQMLLLLETLQNNLGLSYLLITHDLGVVAYLGHRVAVMHQGQIVEQGSVENILNQPQNEYTRILLANSQRLFEDVK